MDNFIIVKTILLILLILSVLLNKYYYREHKEQLIRYRIYLISAYGILIFLICNQVIMFDLLNSLMWASIITGLYYLSLKVYLKKD
ncbi:hypothetical protein FCS83_09545 [Oenococcus sp. UCMA 17063]|nr:hypothetical protein [Oenococcus sp. UCMA 17063]